MLEVSFGFPCCQKTTHPIRNLPCTGTKILLPYFLACTRLCPFSPLPPPLVVCHWWIASVLHPCGICHPYGTPTTRLIYDDIHLHAAQSVNSSQKSPSPLLLHCRTTWSSSSTFYPHPSHFHSHRPEHFHNPLLFSSQ